MSQSVVRIVASVVLAAGYSGLSQVWAQSPAFEVASIKPNKSAERGWSITPPKSGRFTAKNVTVTQLLDTAYHVEDFLISGGPAWLHSERYDVVAKAPDASASADQVRLMLQALLAERFQLAVHRETKEMPV